MGSYNSQYENYYRNLGNKRKSYGGYSYGGASAFGSNKSRLDSNFLMKRLMVDLIGVLAMFIIVMGCKLVVTPTTAAVYNYSKELVNKSYDYNKIVAAAKNFKISEAQQKIMDTIEKVKINIGGGKSIKEKIKQDFSIPAGGTITSSFGYRDDPFTKEKKLHEGIDIDLKEGTDVKCPSSGRVKECGEDGQLGKYILLDHGSGIETKYAHLSELLVKKDDKVEKGQVFAKSGNTGKSTAPHLHFELLYMGENKNPEEYLNFSAAK
jgi:murein DD-endopeptidase MepM/ murein hydrolase activator NlpD